MYKKIEKCRLCDHHNLKKIYSLGEQTLTGVFPKKKDEHITSGPLDLVKCQSCGLVQLEQTYDQNEMYGENYGYRSGLNKSMINHLKENVQMILNLNILEDNDIIIDVGSNDGSTLKMFPHKYRPIGIDPTAKKFSQYYSDDIKLVTYFFTSVNALAATKGEKAKLITSFSMFYDLEEPLSFAKDISSVLHDQGIWVLEQSYLPSMLKTNSFDTICHEHLEYYCLTQIQWIADNTDLRIIDVDFNDTNGGSFIVTMAKDTCTMIPNNKKIQKILSDEKRYNANLNMYNDFKKNISKEKDKFLDFLKTAKEENKLVVGLGASTKGNVMLQHYNINNELISFIGDVNPDKHGSFTPKSLIPIVSEENVIEMNPDYYVIIPWHFKKHFISLEKFKDKRLVFPLPFFEIL